jgi:hypothetical protein
MADEIQGGGGEAAAEVAKPDVIPDKFWDAEAKAPRVEDLAKSYTALESAMGRRIQEVSPETRRAIAEAMPDAVRGDWEQALRGRLIEDPEFLAPLEEQWRGKNLPQAPEAYDVPTREDDRTYDAEHPIYTAAAELAKKHGLSQEAFAEIMDLNFQARADYETPPDIEQWKAAIPDIEQRSKAVYNRLLSASPDHAKTLIDQVRDPNAFLALEAVVKAGNPKALALQPGHGAEPVTQAKLDEMMRDPRYWREKDRDYIASVTKGFNQLYPGDTL